MPTKKKKQVLYSFNPKEVLNTHRQLFLYGEINDQTANFIKQQLIAYDIVSKLPITLWLSSPGGSCSAGLSIIEIINKIQSPVLTIISGEVCSMPWRIRETGVLPLKG